MDQIPLFKVLMSPDAPELVGDVLQSGHIAQGPSVDRFELYMHEALELHEDQEVLALNSGTSALHLALHLAGVGPGDDVAVSPMTCSATIIPIIHLGARPVWIGIDPMTGLMSPLSLAERITKKTKAVVGIDWAGTPCDWMALGSIAGGLYPQKVSTIEDAAHAMFAKDRFGNSIGWKAKSDGPHYTCWSLQAIKHLTTGDGGLLVTPIEEAERARKLRWFGLDRKSSKDFRCAQDITEAGYKFHMNDIAATIGIANIDLARWAVERHRANARQLFEALGNLERVVVPPWHPGSSWWIYTVLVDDRPSFERYLNDRGIQTSQVHRRNDEHPAFRAAAGEQEPLPGVDHFAAHQVSIPVGWWLTATAIDRIVSAVTEWSKHRSQRIGSH